MNKLVTRILTFGVSPVVVASLFAGSLRESSEPSMAATAIAAPVASSLADAQRATDVLTNSLVAAVASISDATPLGSSPAQIRAGSKAVSVLLADCQRGYRLIDASGTPIDRRNVARDRFERRGLAALAAGAPVVQQARGRMLRTLVPLTNDLHPNCVTCHTGYGAMAPGTVVGAASLRMRF